MLFVCFRVAPRLDAGQTTALGQPSPPLSNCDHSSWHRVRWLSNRNFQYVLSILNLKSCVCAELPSDSMALHGEMRSASIVLTLWNISDSKEQSLLFGFAVCFI